MLQMTFMGCRGREMSCLCLPKLALLGIWMGIVLVPAAVEGELSSEAMKTLQWKNLLVFMICNPLPALTLNIVTFIALERYCVLNHRL